MKVYNTWDLMMKEILYFSLFVYIVIDKLCSIVNVTSWTENIRLV